MTEWTLNLDPRQSALLTHFSHPLAGRVGATLLGRSEWEDESGDESGDESEDESEVGLTVRHGADRPGFL